MGPGEMVEIGGRMDRRRYLDILTDVMMPRVRNVYPEGQINFVQDNSSVHRSRPVMDWFSRQRDITLISWPS